ncbi:MAG: indolepyruvate oxidoreductase subunit beta [Planctomycetota bacterium]
MTARATGNATGDAAGKATGRRSLELVICGLGGQGALFLSRLLAEAAMADGREVLSAEMHGMARRGGAVEAFVKIGEFASPLVRPGRADLALVLDRSRVPAARRLLREGGACFVDARAPVEGADAVGASECAREAGHWRGANLVLLGFASSARPDLFPSRQSCLEALRRISPRDACQRNLRAFGAGGDLFEAGR